jgi:hypothetical protein
VWGFGGDRLVGGGGGIHGDTVGGKYLDYEIPTRGRRGSHRLVSVQGRLAWKYGRGDGEGRWGISVAGGGVGGGTTMCRGEFGGGGGLHLGGPCPPGGVADSVVK